MTLFICWIVAPLVLLMVSVGCGLLVERLAGRLLPGGLVAPVGLATLTVVEVFATTNGTTARLAVPAVIGLAVLGYLLARPRSAWRPDGWLVVACVLTFLAFAAPIVLSGSATFAGYISLDDTATWFALTDHVMAHGRSVAGLPASTYEVVLHDNLAGGYPVGAFMGLGTLRELTHQDPAWLFQPMIAFYGVMLAATLYAGCRGLVRRRALCAAVAVLSAQPALLFSYAMWSGVKELAAAGVVALIAVLVGLGAQDWRSGSPRRLFPAAIAVAALVAVLSPAGAIWLVAPAATALAWLVRRGARGLLAAGGVVAAITALCIPELVSAGKFLGHAASGDVTQSNEVANLGHPLSVLQVFGIWPATDFRAGPHDRAVTYILLAVLLAAAVWLVAGALRRDQFTLPLVLATAVVGVGFAVALEHLGLGSPWLTAKALAEGSPAFVVAAAAGVAMAFEQGRRVEAVVAAVAIAVGVLWSNGLTYRNVWLAPAGQMRELARIDSRFSGDGPTFLTEYQPYAVRHFLRDMAPEAASERRVRPDLLRSGAEVPTGGTADLDEFALDTVITYPTIVLRTSPVESRPPSTYQEVFAGHWYDVWQTAPNARAILEHVPLGTAHDPAALPSCDLVRGVAAKAAAAGGVVAAAEGPVAPLVVDLAQTTHPARWLVDPAAPGTLVPYSAGTATTSASLAQDGVYTFWLGGSFRRTMTILVDGKRVGSVTHQLNNGGQWTSFGATSLAAGAHTISLEYGGSPLRPGTGGYPFGMGPLVIARSPGMSNIVAIAPSAASSLCGRRLDWIEALGS